MLRASLFALALICLAAPRASADCVSTCGDICYVVPESAFVRVEVLSTTDGYSSQARIVQRLGGSPAIAATPGEELGIYSRIPLAVGEQAFVTISRYSDTLEQYVWNTSWPIRNEQVICAGAEPNVPLAQYVAMGESNDCEAIADDIGISYRCDDNYERGCAAGPGSPGLLLALLALGRSRRRRRG
jgi:hypothetical protein